MPSLSVIIPTHKRASILAKCIEHLENQTISGDIEVIVVSDGHDPETVELFSQKQWSLPVSFTEIEKAQQGIARNVGLQKAQSPRVLFIGDDMFLSPESCKIHRDSHPDSAVLGYISWDPDVGISDAMQWLDSTGWQFGYPLIKQYEHKQIPTYTQERFTYTSNISLPTAIVQEAQFREDISLYGWEDIEWGMRLRDKGVALYYEPEAKALHHHHISYEQSIKRMFTLGQSSVHFAKIAPHFNRLPTGWKYVAYCFAALLPTMSGRHRKAFLHGIRSAKQAS